MTRADLVERRMRASMILHRMDDLVLVGRALAEHEELHLKEILAVDERFGREPIMGNIPIAEGIVNMLTLGKPPLLVRRFLEDGVDVDTEVLADRIRELLSEAPSAECLEWSHRTLVVWQWIGEAKGS